MSRNDDELYLPKGTTKVTFKLTMLLVMVILVLSIAGGVTRSMGLWGQTVVERKVFENSYQRSASLKAEIATNEATLQEINQKLMNPNLDENTRFNLEAQASAIRIRIATAKGQQ